MRSVFFNKPRFTGEHNRAWLPNCYLATLDCFAALAEVTRLKPILVRELKLRTEEEIAEGVPNKVVPSLRVSLVGRNPGTDTIPS